MDDMVLVCHPTAARINRELELHLRKRSCYQKGGYAFSSATESLRTNLKGSHMRRKSKSPGDKNAQSSLTMRAKATSKPGRMLENLRNFLVIEDMTIGFDPSIAKVDERGTVHLHMKPLFVNEQQAMEFLDRVSKSELNISAMGEDIKAFSPKGRTLRKAFERPRPDLPADAPVNRQRKQIALAPPRDLIDDVNQAAKKHGVDRNSFIEAAIRRMIQPK